MILNYVLSQPGYNLFAEKGTIPAWLLILFLALGFLLVFLIVAVIVYFILRELGKNKPKASEQDAEQTQEDAGVQSSTATHLPIGTALKDGLYQVDEVVTIADGLNAYLVNQTQPLYLCPHCNVELENDTNAFCRSCGAALDVTPPTYPKYLMREAETPGTFAIAERLIGMNLQHPSLILPVETFADNVLGSPMQYLISPVDQEPRLSTTRTPLPLNAVLAIGVNLAEGMAYLHTYSVVLNHLSPDMVAYPNKDARWICYGNVNLLSSEEEGSYAQQFSENVQALTIMLQGFIGGSGASSSTAPLPDVVSELLLHYSNPAESVTADNLVRSLRQVVRMLGGHNEVQYRLGFLSDVGQLRKLNEDSMLSHNLSVIFKELGVTIVVTGVADGVGGHAAGDVASQLAVTTLETHIDALREDARVGRIPEARDWLGKSASAANEMVYKGRAEAGNNMACTLVLAFFTGDMATILNVGDSRGYLLNKRGIRQITTDHSLVERLVSIGEITREQARHHPRKSVIYRVIGDRLKLEYDVFEQTFVPGEALLMCSDGLTDMVEDATIWRIWRASTSPQEAVEKLVAEANAAGGTDNITVVIVEIVA